MHVKKERRKERKEFLRDEKLKEKPEKIKKEVNDK